MSEHVLKMQARAAAAVQATNAASDSLLHAFARHVADVHARAPRVAHMSQKRLVDAAEEADTNAKQLIAWAAIMEHSAHDAFDAPVFAFQNLCNWLVLPVANLADVDLYLLHRVFSVGIDVGPPVRYVWRLDSRPKPMKRAGIDPAAGSLRSRRYVSVHDAPSNSVSVFKDPLQKLRLQRDTGDGYELRLVQGGLK